MPAPWDVDLELACLFARLLVAVPVVTADLGPGVTLLATAAEPGVRFFFLVKVSVLIGGGLVDVLPFGLASRWAVEVVFNGVLLLAGELVPLLFGAAPLTPDTVYLEAALFTCDPLCAPAFAAWDLFG